MKMLAATPALPVRDVPSAVAFYRDRLGFGSRHVAGGFGIMQRDDIEIHLWEANSPDTPGAEPHLAGSASCRVRVEGLHELYDEYRAQGVIHPNGALAAQPWGVEDFTVLDLDDNAIAFFEPVPHPSSCPPLFASPP
jgi:catechol 2,3-dioxygenase-like lactoylglutathione lyase family enzyme